MEEEPWYECINSPSDAFKMLKQNLANYKHLSASITEPLKSKFVMGDDILKSYLLQDIIANNQGYLGYIDGLFDVPKEILSESLSKISKCHASKFDEVFDGVMGELISYKDLKDSGFGDISRPQKKEGRRNPEFVCNLNSKQHLIEVKTIRKDYEVNNLVRSYMQYKYITNKPVYGGKNYHWKLPHKDFYGKHNKFREDLLNRILPGFEMEFETDPTRTYLEYKVSDDTDGSGNMVSCEISQSKYYSSSVSFYHNVTERHPLMIPEDVYRNSAKLLNFIRVFNDRVKEAVEQLYDYDNFYYRHNSIVYIIWNVPYYIKNDGYINQSIDKYIDYIDNFYASYNLNIKCLSLG